MIGQSLRLFGAPLDRCYNPRPMKTLLIREHGDLDVLRFEDAADPVPACDEVVVDVRAVALNHLDLWARRGVPGFKFPLPLVPGCDAAGIVSAVGDRVSGVAVGDEVVIAPGTSCGRCEACLKGRDHHCANYGIFGEHRDGLLRERVAVPAVNVIAKPAGLSFAEASSIGIPFQTAWHMVVHRARVVPGETILVQAAGSGVSAAAIQIAKRHGATVIATAGSAEKLERARDLGIDHGIDYTKQDVAKTVKQITNGRGVPVVIDHVGTDTFAGSLRSLAWQGRFVTCGATSGAEAKLDLRHVFFKSLSILGSTMGSRGELIEILRHVEAGSLRPVIGAEMPWTEIAEAHRRLEAREVFGKVVVTLEP